MYFLKYSPHWQIIQTKIVNLNELTQARGNTLRSDIHKLINSIRNEDELQQQWKEPFTVPIYKNGDKSDYSNYIKTSLLPTIYKILSNTHLSRLTPYVDGITGDHQSGFRRNRSNTDQIFCTPQIFQNK
jgi:hypothetical protein